MDRLAALLEELPLPEIARLLRRTALSALGVGVVALVVSVLLNHPLVGLGAVVGLLLGIVNLRLITRSVARVNELQPAHPKRILAGRTLVRLALTTVVVIGMMFASTQLGLASAAGLAVFYLFLVASLLATLLRGAQAPA
ncbi:MAG: ATP synthase subunit I [Actinomycetota bacterium]|nr:ATP synthase subunit I [Actinomycetota bacterium]